MSDPAAQHGRESRDVFARCATITLSDTRSEATDISGALIRRLLTEAGHQALFHAILPDDPDRLRKQIDQLLERQDIDAILTTGGTGVSPRDNTIKAIEPLFEIGLPGFGELFRMLSWEQIGSAAMLSRATAGIARDKLIFAMPGSPKAVDLAVSKLIVPQLGHLLRQMRKI